MCRCGGGARKSEIPTFDEEAPNESLLTTKGDCNQGPKHCNAVVLRCAGGLQHVNDDKSNVILLVHGSWSPFLDFGEQLTRQLGGALQSMIAYDSF